MRKIKLAKIITPEIVSCTIHGTIKTFDYQCPNCEYNLSEDFKYCPNCGAEINWTYMDEESKTFERVMNTLVGRRAK